MTNNVTWLKQYLQSLIEANQRPRKESQDRSSSNSGLWWVVRAKSTDHAYLVAVAHDDDDDAGDDASCCLIEQLNGEADLFAPPLIDAGNLHFYEDC